MSVWDSLVGQKPVIDMLSRIAQGDPSQITQSWLICGPPGSGRSNMARAFAAALESPDHGMSAEPRASPSRCLPARIRMSRC